MPSSDAPTPETFEAEAQGLLDAIARARKRVDGIAGLVDGTLDRFRERIDRLIRESEVDNWRQVRIFTRDVDTIAADLGKASKEKRLSQRLVAALDVSLRKARKRDFYGARKAWRKLDKLAEQGAEVRQLQGTYRESYKGVEARIRQLRTQVERLEKIPKPPMSPEDARTFNDDVDAFNEAATAAYLDFLARSRADVAIPLLLDAAQGRGIGVPAPPPNSDPEPLMRLLNNASPQGEAFRSRSFYGLLELPAYSDAKLTHVFGDSRLIRSALESSWSWLKAVREDERRTLQIQWSEDATVLRRRMPAIVEYVERISNVNDAAAKGRLLIEALNNGRCEALQSAARLYATHGSEANKCQHRTRPTGESDGPEDHRHRRVLAAELREGRLERGRGSREDRAGDPVGAGGGTRDGPRWCEGQGVPGDGSDLLRHRAVTEPQSTSPPRGHTRSATRRVLSRRP